MSNIVEEKETYEKEKAEFIKKLEGMKKYEGIPVKNGNAPIRDVLGKFNDDEDVLRAALRVDPLAMYGASERLRSSVEFMTEALMISDGCSYQYCLGEAAKDEDLAAKAIWKFITSKDNDALPHSFMRFGLDTYTRVLEELCMNENFMKKAKEYLQKNIDRGDTGEGYGDYVENAEKKLYALKEIERKVIEKQKVENKNNRR